MEKKIKQIKLDPTLKWSIGEITNVIDTGFEFNIIKTKEQGTIKTNEINWAIKKIFIAPLKLVMLFI